MSKLPETSVYMPDLVEHFQRAMAKHAQKHNDEVAQFVKAVSDGIAATDKYVVYLEDKLKALEGANNVSI